jgi:hypothetical protein
MRAKHKEDPLTHLEYDPELWLEAGVTSGCDRNQVYGFSMIMTQDMRLDCSVSTVVDISQSYTSHQS